MLVKESIIEREKSKIFFHASNNKFDEFNLNNNKMYKEIDLPVWFFTDDLNYAKTFGKYLYKVNLDIKNTFDTSNKKHFKMFIDYLKYENKSKKEIDEILDEQFYKDLPYWTCEDAFYAAISNNFDSILIEEELENEVVSIGVFDTENIHIIKIIEL